MTKPVCNFKHVLMQGHPATCRLKDNGKADNLATRLCDEQDCIFMILFDQLEAVSNTTKNK